MVMRRLNSRRSFLASSLAGAGALAAGRAAYSREEEDPVAPWRTGVRVGPVSKVAGRHTMHTYYLLNPESTDGRHVVFFTSSDRAGHVGQVCLLDRQTGDETVLADEVHTEDAHRAALQQWTAGGRAIAYHEVVGKRWQVVLVDVQTRAKTIVAQDRQLGFGRPDSYTLPLYGCHWNPGEHRDLEFYDVRSGQLRTVVTIDEVERKYGDWLKKEFGGKRVSIAFPTVSPDHRRVFFKLAAGSGGDNFMSSAASHRQGIVFYDLERQRLTHWREKWGHPAWHPDSLHCIEMGNLLFDADGGAVTRIRGVPALRGQHLAVSPCGRLFVSDGLTQMLGGPPSEWAVLVAALRGDSHVVLHQFLGNRGARSWRVSHPHPVFSADGQRIYYNVNESEFTQLYVAERAS